MSIPRGRETGSVMVAACSFSFYGDGLLYLGSTPSKQYSRLLSDLGLYKLNIWLRLTFALVRTAPVSTALDITGVRAGPRSSWSHSLGQ